MKETVSDSQHFTLPYARVGSWPCPKTIDKAEKACHGQTVKLNTKIRKLRTKSFMTLDPEWSYSTQSHCWKYYKCETH